MRYCWLHFYKLELFVILVQYTSIEIFTQSVYEEGSLSRIRLNFKWDEEFELGTN